jgi:hypothetical protein
VKSIHVLGGNYGVDCHSNGKISLGINRDCSVFKGKRVKHKMGLI